MLNTCYFLLNTFSISLLHFFASSLGFLEKITARERLIINPCLFEFKPAFNVSWKSPPYAPTPGTKIQRSSPTIFRTSLSSEGYVAPTTNKQFLFLFHFFATWYATYWYNFILPLILATWYLILNWYLLLNTKILKLRSTRIGSFA